LRNTLSVMACVRLSSMQNTSPWGHAIPIPLGLLACWSKERHCHSMVRGLLSIRALIAQAEAHRVLLRAPSDSHSQCGLPEPQNQPNAGFCVDYM
jgi:hypothetical protein